MRNRLPPDAIVSLFPFNNSGGVMNQGMFAALAVTVILAGCGKSAVEDAHELVKSVLTDPESAAFEGEQVHANGSKLAVCGKVNAKNKMGGYVGFQRYIVADGAVTIMTEENAADFAGKYLELCDYKTVVKS
jgi:hypothetical protein